MTGPQLLEGVAGKEGVTLIRQGLQFSHKNKSEIFKDKKKFISKKIFQAGKFYLRIDGIKDENR